MTKRSKLMLGLSGMLLLAGGVAATGTFAWFTATGANVSAGDAAVSGALTAATTSATMGSFTVTPIIHTAINGSIVVSDDDGNVFVEDKAHAVKTDANSANAITTTYKTAVIDLNITYSGALDTDDEVTAAWGDAGTHTNYSVTVSDATGYTGTTPSAAIVAHAGVSGKKDGIDYGLKFKTGDAPTRASDGWKNGGTAGTKTNTLAVSSINLTSADFAKVSSTWTATVETTATFYIGIVGIDGVAQASSDSYSCSFAVSGGAIA